MCSFEVSKVVCAAGLVVGRYNERLLGETLYKPLIRVRTQTLVLLHLALQVCLADHRDYPVGQLDQTKRLVSVVPIGFAAFHLAGHIDLFPPQHERFAEAQSPSQWRAKTDASPSLIRSTS